MTGLREEHRLENDRCEKFLTRLLPDRFWETIPLPAEYRNTGDSVPWEERKNGAFRPIAEGETWGRTWENAWFHFSGDLPASWRGAEVVLQVNLYGETMFFDDTGCPIGAVTGGSVFDIRFLKELFWLPAEQSEAGKVDLWAEAVASLLFGVELQQETPRLEPIPKGHHEARAVSLRIGRLNREAWQLYYDFQALWELCRVMPEEGYRRRQLMAALMGAVNAYGDDPANAAAARAVLARELRRPATDSALISHAVGHAHIDVGWLWPVRESTRKAARTFSSQLDMIRRYPGYVFGASQPQLYAFVKERYPELFRRIGEAVKAGRWELQGGMWVEADGNIPSGESLIRQFLHGKNFFMDEFGVEVRNLWLPDVFGYSAALPQIIRKARCDYFLTQKLSWNDYDTFPYNTFRWRGIDGSVVIAHFPPENSYNAHLNPGQMLAGQDRFAEGDRLPGYLTLFGIGDGGGGPSEAFLERGRRVANLEGCPKVRFGKAEAYFDSIAPKAAELAEWDGELYLENHRGTLTTQARTKRANRQLEQALTALEAIAAAGPWKDYPAAALDRLWKTLLINQFHDILPGSAIREVYEVTEREHREALAECAALTEAALRRVAVPDAEALLAANTLPDAYRGLVALPEAWGESGLRDEAGRDLPCQTLEGKRFALVEIPASAFATFRRAPAGEGAVETERMPEPVLENDFVRYRFDAAGELVSAFDKECGREVLPPGGSGNRLMLNVDRPNFYDAWNIDPFCNDEKQTRPKRVEIGAVERGPAASQFRMTLHIGDSVVEQTVRLLPGSRRLDFICRADWREEHRLLRVAFDAEIFADEGLYEIQYGYLRRPLHENTSWDKAKFEVSCQRYMDLSEKHYGAALLNDGKYGCRIRRNTMILSLLRSPRHPDAEADRGEQFFTYAFLPHREALPASCVMAEAGMLNRPPRVLAGFAGAVAAPFRADSPNVGLEVVKRAEKADAWILRLVERCGESGEVVLTLPPDRTFEVCETDLLEWENLRPCAVADGRVKLRLTPFEIKTLRVEETSGDEKA